MAPEQGVADSNVDHRADIYALGVLAYDMLTAKPPFTDSTTQAVMAAHVSRAPRRPPSKHRPSIPAPLRTPSEIFLGSHAS